MEKAWLFLATLSGGWNGVSRVSVLAGLIVGVAGVLRFLRARRSLRVPVVPSSRAELGAAVVLSYTRGAHGAFAWPITLLWFGFWVGGQLQNGGWIALVVVLVVSVLVSAVRLLRTAHEARGDSEVAPAALAALLAAGLLLLVGLLLVVRLVIAPVPGEDIGQAMTGSALGQTLFAVVLPAAALLLVLNARVVWRRTPGWVRRAWTAIARRGVRWLDFVHRRRYVLGLVLVFAVFASALEDRVGKLTFFGVATPEYGKVLYIWLLGALLAGFAQRFGRPGHFVRDHRHLLYPMIFFAAVGTACFVKSDLGPLIGLFAATIGMMVYLVRAGVRRSAELRGLSVGRQLIQLASLTRWYFLGLLGTVLLGVLFISAIPYVGARVDGMAHPWQYSWTSPCVPPPDDADVPRGPDGLRVCREAKDAAAAATRSQVAHGLAVIADGGLWGRGLGDTGSASLPLGSSDFVIAVIWGKLGGVAVILLAVLLALLVAALSRAVTEITGRHATRAGLFTAGFGILLLVQFCYVLLATLAIVPHSGIAAPFLARGGQSTLALGLGVALALFSAYREPAVTQTPARLQPRRPDPVLAAARSRRIPVLGVAMLVFGVACTAIITAMPYRGYAKDRPYCLTANAFVDPAVCSTDQIAMRRTSVVLSFGGAPQFQWDRRKATWRPIGQLTQTDLAGLVQAGGQEGAVDGALRQLVQASTGLSNPLLPPPPDDAAPGVVELTIAPDIQRRAATALRADAAGTGPLAGGVVVVEAATGRVLAAASAPGPLDLPPVEASSVADGTQADFGSRHPAGILTEDGTVDEDKSAECVEIDLDNRCARWRLAPAAPPERKESVADRRRYVEDRTDVELPSTEDNRAVKHNYGLGSTFKVVVASAYLRAPGTSVQDEVPAPRVFDTPAGPVANHNGGECRGTRNGKISIARALAVSCNTAFLELATEVGWPAIRDTAADFGFTVGPTDARPRGPAWVAGLALGTDSRVPRTATTLAGLSNDVLGGGEVDGTPLQMASVMATVVNGGTLVQPRLVDAVTAPHGGTRVPVRAATRQVLTGQQAAELMDGLSGTVRPGGTAQKMPAHPGHPLWLKTGTHDLYDGKPPPPGRFVSQIAWLVGGVDTAAGPVAFAVAVETGDEGRGAARARWVANEVITGITEVRG